MFLSSDVCSSDRKSTRLNSSHTIISYAVFCLKKKMHPGLLGQALTGSSPAGPPRPLPGLVGGGRLCTRDAYRQPTGRLVSVDVVIFFLMMRDPPDPSLFPPATLFG